MKNPKRKDRGINISIDIANNNRDETVVSGWKKVVTSDGYRASAPVFPSASSPIETRRKLLTGNSCSRGEWYALQTLDSFMYDDIEPFINSDVSGTIWSTLPAGQVFMKQQLYSVRINPDTKGGWIMDVTRCMSGIVRRAWISANEYARINSSGRQDYFDRVFCATVQEIRNAIGEDGSILPGSERAAFGLRSPDELTVPNLPAPESKQAGERLPRYTLDKSGFLVECDPVVPSPAVEPPQPKEPVSKFSLIEVDDES